MSVPTLHDGLSTEATTIDSGASLHNQLTKIEQQLLAQDCTMEPITLDDLLQDDRFGIRPHVN